MTTGVGELLKDLARTTRIGTILQVGQGDAAAALATGAAAVVVALPKPLVGAELRALATDEQRLVLHQAAVGAGPGQAPLQLFNFAALSGLSAPAPALTALYPGLDVTARPEIELVALDGVIDSLPSDPQGAEVLILDQPGSEARLLEALLAGPAAARFAHVLLRAGVEALYADSQPLADLATRLEAAGYRIAGQDLEDPDLPVTHFRLEPLWFELRAARTQVETLTEARDKLAATLEARTAERDEARNHAQALTEARDKLAAILEARTAERDEARNQTRKAEEKAARTASQLRTDTVRLQAELNHQTALNRSLQGEFIRVEVQMELLRSLVAPLSLGPAETPPQSESDAAAVAEPRPSRTAKGDDAGRSGRPLRS